MAESHEPLLIVGVGPATGTELARLLAGRYQLLLVARSAERIGALADALDHTHAFSCDVSDSDAWADTLGRIRREFGAPRRVVVNTESATWGAYNELPLAQFGASFQVNTVALLQLVQQLYPDPASIPTDSRVIVSSSPAAYTPPANFLGLAPSRVAQRVLAELLHENLSDQGLRFSVFSIDGAIDEPKMRAMLPDKPTAYFIQPTAIAAAMAELLSGDAFPLHTGISGPSAFGGRNS